MFENTGSKIKVVAWVVFVAGIAATVIGTLVSGGIADQYGQYRVTFWSVLLKLAGGALGSFVTALLLYAFGEITENTKRTARWAEETAEAAKTAAKAVKAAETAAPAPRVFRKVNISEDWTCKKCGCRNEKGSLSCKDCGAYR